MRPAATTAVLGPLALILASAPSVVAAAPNHVTVLADDQGYKLQIDGQDTFVKGMNWGYVPIGENYSYDFWGQPDAFIEAALRDEMKLLSAMGVNTIRQYPGIPPKWLTWIYENYGITTMINPLMGRYGVSVQGTFVPVVDYSDPGHRAAIKAETMAAVERYKDVEGVLFFLLGNENNYGLSWKSFEIEALPEGERQEAKARHLYSLFGELVDDIHAVDAHHPVAIANGDLQYLDLVAELVPNLDIMGSNVYRGPSARDLYQRVEDELGVPFVYTEFGSDAYNARTGREDGLSQAELLHAQWTEIYAEAYGHGGVGNSIGGYVFQWADGWWKYLQEENLDIHDTNASWPNQAYMFDWVEGDNNMNEEWFGICAKGPTQPDGSFELFPRPAYYMLREAFQLDPYHPDTSLPVIRSHFASIDPAEFVSRAESGILGQKVADLQKVQITDLRLELTSFVSQQTDENGVQTTIFDHMENFWLGVRAEPTRDVSADMRVSILGNTPDNRIDELYWEAAGAERLVTDDEGQLADLSPLQRVRVHDAGFSWNHRAFRMKGYYRQGHFHWGYEGDFFGLYREANYGPNPDIYQAAVPIGVEVEGKGPLDGVKLAMGPQVYWGANPTAIAKIREPVGPVTVTLMHQEDIARTSGATTSSLIAEPMLRRSTVVMETGQGGNGLTVGGMMAGTNKVGQTFRSVQPAASGTSYAGSGDDVLTDEVSLIDTLGFRAKLAHTIGPISGYVQGGIQGLVADGGPDAVPVFTGWRLKQTGRGNQRSVLGGLALNLGRFQIAPSALYQKPIVGPLPVIGDGVDPTTGRYNRRVVPRNFLDDPFIVRENRETTAVELLLVYDPTPGSWMWMWDNFVREDARFSAAIDAVYRMQPTSTDSHIGFLADGTLFSFDAAPPPVDTFDVTGHVHLRPRGDFRLRLSGYGGTKQSTGSDTRLITAYGGMVTGWFRNMALDTTVRVNDWGPYDYHRDFNLTFPFQAIVDLSGGWARPNLQRSQPRVGVRAQYRTLDQYSPDGLTFPGQEGVEWEVGTYAHIGI
jgi:hypothetical protein